MHMKGIKKYFYCMVAEQKKLKGYFFIMFFLNVLSVFFIFCVKLRLLVYKLKLLKTKKISVPVISVGNVNSGGSGKTPFVQLLCDILKKDFSKTSAVLTRGYGAFAGSCEGKNITDEEAVLKENLQDTAVFAGRDRIKNAGIAVNDFKSDCIVLDDGFQYLKIQKDFDIVLIKSNSLKNNRKVLPAGLLREPYSHLKRADLIVITDADLAEKKQLKELKDFLKSKSKKSVVLTASYKPLNVFDFVSDKNISIGNKTEENFLAFSGIGDPESFEKILGKTALNITNFYRYPDHYKYSERDIKHLVSLCQKNLSDGIITTQKDIYKILKFKKYFIDSGICIIAALKVSMQLNGNSYDEIYNRLYHLFNS